MSYPITATRPDPGLIVLRSPGITLTVSSERPLDKDQVVSLAGGLAVSCSQFFQTDMREILPVLMRSLREASDGSPPAQ